MIGLLVGGAVGAATGLLLAPGSGEHLRERMRDEFKDIIDAGREAARDKRDELEETLDTMRAKP